MTEQEKLNKGQHNYFTLTQKLAKLCYAYKCTITFPNAEVIDGSTWTVVAGVVVTYFKGKLPKPKATSISTS